MNRRFVAALAVVATCVATFTMGPAPAGAAPLTTPVAGNLAPGDLTQPPASCSAPPADPDATPANRDRFISLWAPRFADKAWFQDFAKLDAVPADILAEGFHSMSKPTQAWLVACLLDHSLAAAGQVATPAQVANYQLGLDLIIFNKASIASARKELAKTSTPAPAPLPPAPTQLTANALTGMSTDLAADPSLTSAVQPKADVTTPNVSASADFSAQASVRLQNLNAAPAVTPQQAKLAAPPATPSTTQSLDPGALLQSLDNVLNIPLAATLLQAVADVEQLVANIQKVLFTLPVVNLLASAFYRVCAESPTQPLACSVYLPVGVPIPADVTGDNFPDVLAELIPAVNVTGTGVDVGVAFSVTRLYGNTGPLPAHVFAVYDTPVGNKRIEFGYDGRASSLANNTATNFWLHNVVAALAGDVDVSADVSSISPGSTEALTFAIKNLVGGSPGVPATEADPTTGAVQFNPFPAKFSAAAHLIHNGTKDEDIINVQSSTPSTVNAVINQDTTTTTPKSHRQFTALVDKLPTSVNVDLLHQGQKQVITYNASAAIAHVQATDTATPDTSHPGSYTHSVYDVQGVPTAVQVTLQGAQDILYTASAKVPQVSFSTQTLKDSVLQQQITAQANQIPTSVHVTNTTADQSVITYDANDVLPLVKFSMYDFAQDQTNLLATATGIPTHMQVTQTKSTGVFDFSANAGIGQINATLTRGGGLVIPLPGDHATVYKRGIGLGVDLQLSGFQSAHFDGSQKTIVSVGLSPGGQSFDALADLDDPNVLATVHVSKLPATMSVTIDPVGGSATYGASSVIPDLHGSFTKRDTMTYADFKLTNVPKNITLSFNTAGAAPQITYIADSRLGSIEGNYQAAPGGLSFHALISDLPQFMHIGGQDPMVFDARSSSIAAPGTSYLGQVFFQYATDGTFQSPPTTDDHVYANTAGGQTHAELLYTGLQFISVDTSNQELHAEVRNVNPRLIRAYLTTDNLTATGFIDKVPADVKIDQVGNDMQYHASSAINEIYTNVHRTNGDVLTADVTGVPATIDVLFDAANSKLDWNASAATGGISVIAHLTAATLNMSRDFDASLTITDIPSHWFATFGNGNIDFEAGGTGIGAISAQVSNHGAYHVLAGDHLSAYYDQPSGDVDASLHISNLTKAAFTKLTDASGGGFIADFNMGTHGALGLSAQINLGANRLVASGGFDHLPSTIHLKSDGGRIQYNGNDNPTLTLTVAAGDSTALSATPIAPSVHGLSVRDGQSGTGKAVRANLFITGLPDSLDLNTPAGTYTVNNFHPSIDPLVVDAKLTTIAAQPLSLELQQVIGTATPVSFTFGPFLSSTAPDGTHSLSLNYTASRDLGSLTAEATYGNTDDAKLMISEIPGGTAPSISVSAAFGDQKNVHIAMSHGISDITASYKHVGDATFAASVHLHQVPSSVDLLIGRGSAADGSKTVTAPDFTFTASSAGMDIDAFANADIVTPADITAAVQLQVTDLGQTVTGGLDGTSLHITSSPATGSFLLTAAGTVDIGPIDLGFGDGGTGFNNTGSLTVHVKVKQLTLGFTTTSDLNLDLGITTGLHGDFGLFTLGEDSDTQIDIEDHLSLDVDFGIFGTAHIPLLDIGPMTIDLHNVIDHFHLNTNTVGPIFNIDVFDFGVAYCGVDINIRPAPFGSTAGSTIALPQPPDDGHSPAAWLITPDPNFFGFTLPDWALDVVAYFASPYGHELGASPACHSRI